MRIERGTGIGDHGLVERRDELARLGVALRSARGVVVVEGEAGIGKTRLIREAVSAPTLADRQIKWGELARASRATAGVLRIAIARNDVASAGRLARRLLDTVAGTEMWVRAAPVMPFAPLALVAGNFAHYRAGVAGRDAPLATAGLAFAEGRLAEYTGDRAAAAVAYAKARRLYREIPDVRYAAHAAEAEGRVLGGKQGADAYREAYRTFARLEERWEINRVKQSMRHVGVRLSHRAGRRGYGEAQSPREREVADLVAHGHSNQQIAEQLFLSPRTVEAHVARILRKLDITSRRELRGTTGVVDVAVDRLPR